MKLLYLYIKKFRGLVFGALVLATINRIFQLVDPQIFRLLIDNYANKISELTPHEFIVGVLLLLLANVAAAFISRVANNFQLYYVNVITQKVGAQLYAQSVKHSFSLPYSAFEDQRSGELLQKLQKARTDSQVFIAGFINTVFFSVIGIIFVLAYAFYVHWSIGFVYFLIIPILATVTLLISRRIKKVQAGIIKQSADLAGSTTETLRNVQLVKSLGLENQEVKRLNAVNDEILQLELQKVKLIRKMLFTQGTLINALRSVLMLLMFWLIFKGQITLGEFFSLLFYSFFIFTPLTELGTVISSYQESSASMEQMEEILKMPSETRPKNPKNIDSLKKIEFKKVSFQYHAAPSQALENISFKITGGGTIAFAGLSGSGKTTLLKLISGLYKPSDGEIYFNDFAYSEVDFTKIRNQIGLVAQETQLFSGTIRENLLFVKPKASDKECLAVLKAAAAQSILARAEKGLDTKIGESGLKLSGGERQRLAIARALLRKPDLIIFDEATSSLDSLTEAEITNTIRSISKVDSRLMTILVAHRLSTIMHADTIYVLEGGKIIEAGRHEDLIKNHGLYAAMWREQSSN